jgi:hypothetical protein
LRAFLGIDARPVLALAHIGSYEIGRKKLFVGTLANT